MTEISGDFFSIERWVVSENFPNILRWVVASLFQIGLNSERIFSCRALVEPGINFWKEGLTANKDMIEGNKLSKSLDEKRNEM